MFRSNVADKYASAVTNNLGLRCNFWPCSWGRFLITNPSFMKYTIEKIRIQMRLHRDFESTVYLFKKQRRRRIFLSSWSDYKFLSSWSDYACYPCSLFDNWIWRNMNSRSWYRAKRCCYMYIWTNYLLSYFYVKGSHLIPLAWESKIEHSNHNSGCKGTIRKMLKLSHF